MRPIVLVLGMVGAALAGFTGLQGLILLTGAGPDHPAVRVAAAWFLFVIAPLLGVVGAVLTFRGKPRPGAWLLFIASVPTTLLEGSGFLVTLPLFLAGAGALLLALKRAYL